MKILLIFLIFVMSLGIFFLADSNALVGPAAPREHQSLPYISLQLTVRNSDGVLVAYNEPQVFWLRNVNYIHQFLDEQENKTIIFIDGKKHEQIEFGNEHYFRNGGNQISMYVLGWEGNGIINAEMNGYISGVGDTLSATWKIIRPVE